MFVNSESGEFYQPCCPDPEIRRIADFENERRFLPLDLLYARPVGDDMRAYLTDHGMPADEYAWFMQQDVRRARDPRRRLLRVEREADRQRRACADARRAVRLVCHRQPILRALPAADDAHRDQPHGRPRGAALALAAMAQRPADPPRRRAGRRLHLVLASPTRSIGTSRSEKPLGNVNPVGLFDLNRDPRPVGHAYQHLVHLFDADLAPGPDPRDGAGRGAVAHVRGSEEAPCLACFRPTGSMPARRNGRCSPAPLQA